MRSIYLGRSSAYAVREGVYVKDVRKEGIDVFSEAAGIAYLVLRDYRRGYTYDHYGKKIKMSRELFMRRLRFIIPLARKHGATKSTLKRIYALVKFVAKRNKLPKSVKASVKKALAKA